ncbi:MAG: hypothetical protein IPJ51_21480 [Saprospiraceae bacterium]|nr:hypothetical protein [Saprospiraceae bacterium]
MGQVKNEIANAIKTLNLGSDLIELLDDKTGFEIFQKCLDRFVNSGDRKRWWEDFKNISFSVDDLEMPFEHLEEYTPNLESKVWLVVEDDDEIFYPAYICSPKIIGQLIGECFGFEYYIVDINFKWLICENHHSRLIGTGNFDRT